MNVVDMCGALALLRAIAVPLTAHVQTGSNLERVSDEQGAAVPGVAITITSSALVAGTATGTSDAAGCRRYVGWTAGP